MNIVSNRPKLCFFMCLILSPLLLSACGATEKASELPECRPTSTENCEMQEEKDRKYDPCLINENLPVCKL
jgi:hypothetical protein